MPGKQENGPVTNGTTEKRHSTFDPDDPLYIKDLQRPAVIKEDLNEMERRKRVREILDSKPFRKELEELINHEKASGNEGGAERLATLEKLSELILPRGQLAAATLHGISSQAIVPIADLRGSDVSKYTKQEKILRNKLAALYRLVDLFQWSQGIYNHVTLRISPESDELLINPFGLLYHEVSAASLVKIKMDGEILDSGTTNMGINEAGFVLHSTIHQARPDVRCVIHMHTAVVGAVAAMKCGLLPISQEAMIVGPVSYHNYEGIVNDENERTSLAQDLGPDNKVMMLRNHGFIACGTTVEEAMHLSYNLVHACETQVVLLRGDGYIVVGESLEEAVFLTRNLIQACEQQIRAVRAGIENLVIPDAEAQKKAYATAQAGGGGVLKSPMKGAIKWRVGELEWEAWMRVLDNAGFRSGHLYRQPILRSSAITSGGHQSEVETPPSASAFGLLDETDGEAMTAHRLSLLRKEQERGRWLNSPNAYQKVQFMESGTDHPKTIIKWVQDPTSPVHSTPVKITSPHQFSPMAQNSKEFKEKQKAIKEARRVGEISAGPRSHVLEGVTYEEAQAMKDAELSAVPDRVVTIGTASKGIIERDFQHNAQVYRQLYAPNPFSGETDEDIDRYVREMSVKDKPSTPEKMAPTSPSSDIESPGADTASLMQGVREHSQRMADPPPAPPVKGFVKETTFEKQTTNNDAVTTTRTVTVQKKQPSPSGFFQRSKSERFYRKKHDHDTTTSSAVDGRTVSDEEALNESKDSKKEKKKKKGFFSFGKKDKKKGKESTEV